jgi:hypothetical protein
LRTDAAQARALGVEQARDGDDRLSVVEERQQLDGARESAKHRLGDSSHAAAARLFRGVVLTVRYVNVVPDFARSVTRDFVRGVAYEFARGFVYEFACGVVRGIARVGEGLDEFSACALAVRDEARDVASVHAAARDEQVVARASSDAAQLQLARRGRVRLARRRACEREARVTFDALARGKQRVPLHLAFVPARAQEQVLDLA